MIGLTGSVIAFRSEIDQLVSPRFFAKPQPGVARLDFAALIDRAEALHPNGRVNYIYAAPRQIVIGMGPRTNLATGKPFDLGFEMVFLNPWTGDELMEMKMGDRAQSWLTNPIVTLHASLCMGEKGMLVLGIVALLWTIDCFVGFYLTLPATLERFWLRWKQAWRVKWSASAFRVNFDLHRASGLWLWPALFVFAVSSVLFNLPKVYHGVADRFLEYHEPFPERMDMSPVHDDHPPRIDFRTGLKTAQHLMAEQAAKHGFTVSSQPTVFEYDDYARKYFYNIQSSRDINYSASESFTTLNFNADTGELISLHIPTGEYAGNTVADWLIGLHMVWVFGLPYRIFVSVLGIVIAVLSYTGVYIWWKKWRVRIRNSPPSNLGRRVRPRTSM